MSIGGFYSAKEHAHTVILGQGTLLVISDSL